MTCLLQSFRYSPSPQDTIQSQAKRSSPFSQAAAKCQSPNGPANDQIEQKLGMCFIAPWLSSKPI
jgi:hypothetical protein